MKTQINEHHKNYSFNLSKNLKLFITLMLVLFSNLMIQANSNLLSKKIQTTDSTANKTVSNHNLFVSVRAGYDIPSYYNNTPYIKYKGGVTAGVSVDYYWKWIGVGVDVDFIKNYPKNTYTTTNLQNAALLPITSFNSSAKSITRVFYGIGPDFKYQTKNRKFAAELNTRVGMALIKGGRTLLQETTTPSNDVLNFHGGYNSKTALSVKGQIRLTYFVFPNLGINVGAYYLRHFNVPEQVDATLGASAIYQPLDNTVTPGFSTYKGAKLSRQVPCDCDIASVGVFAGLTYRFAKNATNKKTETVYSLAVTARDKYTHEILPDTKVFVKNSAGEIVKTGQTNAVGVVLFEKIAANDYSISGSLNDVELEGSSVSKKEFSKNKVVEKEILYADRNFIIKGKVFECNTTKPIAGINVVLENTDQAFKKSTMTNNTGEFILQLPAAVTYSLYGKKDNYFSQIETVTASNYNRDKNLFVKLEMCSDYVDCGKAIGLKNILFDLDKYVIKDIAKPELNKLVRFMKDNPTVTVEVSSHTDSRASAEYNQTLSQNRANASVDYIVSQGISRDRITGKGYGESKLLNECADGVTCTEAQHAINRRTEMKVICK
ncbi:MAG TPA: OmpA family protein [Chitinophagales bacterium]|nr:OmpA family protein [Chitinophagales bacterium]